MKSVFFVNINNQIMKNVYHYRKPQTQVPSVIKEVLTTTPDKSFCYIMIFIILIINIINVEQVKIFLNI